LSNNSFLVSLGIDISDKGELCKADDFFLTAGVALAGENFTLVGIFVPPLVVEGMISFAAISLLFLMMRMNEFSSK
jgi:hypothetical protein